MCLERLKSWLGLLATLTLSTQLQAAPIAWETHWNDTVFAQAAREHKFVILDLHAVWCHWCHVMDDQTYADLTVQRLIDAHYIAVSVDADSDPDLSSRYGDWGWPATIVLAADGSEIVKRRGFMPPQQMAALLKAIIEDPSPGPSVTPDVVIGLSGGLHLTVHDRAALTKTYDRVYDEANGGWGDVHKYIDASALELTFAKLDGGDQEALHRARQTLDANLKLIDPVWGGVYQYSDDVSWLSPHYEKLLSFQADDLRLYSDAYSRWQDPRYLAAAESLYRYMTQYLAAPDGGFYVSQDADVSKQITGHEFYLKDDAGRRALGMPRIDTHEYARETGWAIRALCKFYDVSASPEALTLAERAGQWAIDNRASANGSFRHDSNALGGPFLDDSLAMSQAFIALYRSTGNRAWLAHAVSTMTFIDQYFRDPGAGYWAARGSDRRHGVFRIAVRQAEQNAALARVASLMHHYTGDVRYLRMAQHAMKYLTAFVQRAPEQLHAEILLADRELTSAPIHITVVGRKSDRAARDLHSAALRYPSDYLQIDWWDRDEGRLLNPDIQYPQLERAAAFACTANACSMPVFEPEGIKLAVRSALTH